MKIFFFLTVCIAAAFTISGQKVGIGTTSPNPSAILDINSASRGTLLPRMTSGQRKSIINPAQGLLVFDTDKHRLYMFDGMNWLAFSADTDLNQPPFTIVPQDTIADGYFGYCVSISGDYAIIGAPGQLNGLGAAYIYVRISGLWVQQAKLVASDPVFGFFGGSVSISGAYAVVGAYKSKLTGENVGKIYIYMRSGNSWAQQANIYAWDAGLPDHFFGYSVAISGDYVLAGAYGRDSYRGAVYVYQRNGSLWTYKTILLANDGISNDYFGFSIALSGEYAIIGSPYRSAGSYFSQGGAYIFKRSGDVWSQQAVITSNDSANNRNVGYSVSISGDYTVAGAVEDGTVLENARGSAYIFARDGTNWIQKAKLLAPDGVPGDFFGNSVSVSNDYIIVGALWNGTTFGQQGAAYLYKKSGVAWPYVRKIQEPTPGPNFNFGNSVFISGFNLGIGSPNNNTSGVVNAGSVSFLNIE